MKNEIIITNNFEETQKAGEDFIRSHPLGSEPRGRRLASVVALYGDLGAGKTTFVQGLAKGLGIKKRIISPTFILVREYKFKIQNSKVKISSQNPKVLHHVDLYRVQDVIDIKGLGLEEIISDPQNLVVIEWAERMGELLPKKRIDIRFEYLGEEKRKIIISC